MKLDLLESYKIAVEYYNVSGFEVLELLDLRSKLSELENILTVSEKAILESADGILMDNLKSFYEKIQEIGHLPELRRRAKVLPSHWWWYMDKFISVSEKYRLQQSETSQTVEAVS